MQREFIIEDGVTTIHFVGFGQKDYALCGQDLAGDRLWMAGVRTVEKVNCKDCIEIVEYCKKIKSSEYEKG